MVTHFKIGDSAASMRLLCDAPIQGVRWTEYPWDVDCADCQRVAARESVDQRTQPHPFRYFSHCATCAVFRPYTPREAKGWDGRW